MKKRNFIILEIFIFCISLAVLLFSIILLATGLLYNIDNYTMYFENNDLSETFLPKLIIDQKSEKIKLDQNLSKIDKVKVRGISPEYITLKLVDNAQENKITSNFYGSYYIEGNVLTISVGHGKAFDKSLNITLYVKYDLADVVNGDYIEIGRVDDDGNIIMLDDFFNEGLVSNQPKGKNLNNYISDIKNGKKSIRVVDQVLDGFLTNTELCIEHYNYSDDSGEDRRENYTCQGGENLYIDKDKIVIPYWSYVNMDYSEVLIMVNDGKGYEYEIEEDKVVIKNTDNDKTWDVKIENQEIEGGVVYGSIR